MDAVEKTCSVEELLATGERLRTFVENAPVALAMFDRELRFIAANKRYIESFNAPRDLIGRCAYDVFPEIPERWKQVHKRALSGESISVAEDLFLRADLKAQWVNWKIDPWYEKDGAIGGILLAAEDVTSKVEAQSKLRDNEERLTLLMESAQIGTWDWDIEKNKIVSSDLWFQIFGIRPAAEMDYEARLRIVHPDDRERVDRAVKGAVEGKQSYTIEFRTLWPDGSVHWVSSRGKVFCDAAGKPVRVRGAAIDITKLKKTEEDLERARASAKAQADELQAILDAVPALTFVAQDPQCEHMYSSRFAHETLRIPADQNPSKSAPDPQPFEVFAGERRLEAHELPMQQAAATGKAVRNQEFRMKFPDDTFIDIFGHAVPLLDASGAPRGAVGAFVDISERKRAEEMLQARTRELEYLIKAREESELRFQSTFENAAVGIAVLSLEGRWLRVNQKLCDVLGYAREELLEMTFQEITYPDDLERDLEKAMDLIAGKIPTYTMEKRYLRKDGSSVWAELTVSALPDGRGGPQHFISIIQDISARKAAEEALREQGERSEFVAQASDVGFWFCDLPFDKLIWDKRVKAHFWLPEDADVTIDKFYEQLHPDDRDRTRLAMELAIQNHTRYDIEYRTVAEDGRHKWIRAIGRTFYDKWNVPRRFDGVTMDITESRAIDDALRASEAKYRELADDLERQVQARTIELQESNAEAVRISQGFRELSRHVLRVRDEERRKLARELHDSAGQLLTALDLELSSLEIEHQKGAAVVNGKLAMSKELVQQLQREIRTTSYLLHPPLLDEAGLVSALSWYVQGLNQRSGLQTELEIADDFGRIPRDLELVVFRLVQESLTNIHRHSGSKTAFIRVTRDDATICIEIRDEGKGIPAKKLREIQVGGSGVGVQGMRERLRQYGGKLSIESSEAGTRVVAAIPIPRSIPEDLGLESLPSAI